MWVCVFFDLPVKTLSQKRVYTSFRKGLLKDGFEMLQYSIYVRYCSSTEHAETHVNRVKDILPTEGSINILNITDKQYSSMFRYTGASKNREILSKQVIFF